MKVMVMVKASKGSEAGEMPSEELLTAMGKFNEELINAGIMLSGEGLHPSSKGARIRFSGRNRTVIDGPFAETKELVAGFWIWQVKSMDEAIAWVKRCPNPMMEDSDIEIRPLFEAADFGEAFTPELREQEAVLRARTQGLGVPRFENGRALTIAGLKESYTVESRGNIPMQWQQFTPHMNKLAGQADQPAYGVCWNTRPDCSFDYLCGVEVTTTDKLPANFTHVQLPAHRYVIFEHNEHVASIAKTLDAIWTHWAPDCGLKLADTPCFEKYTELFNPETGVGGIEIWIPLAA